jgi:hypothetical protein
VQHGPREDSAIESPIQIGMSEPVFDGVHPAGQPGRDVHVAIDKAGHHRLAGEIDDFGARRVGEAGLNRGDAVVVDENGNLLARSIAHPVEQRAGVDDNVARKSGCAERSKEQDNEGAADEFFHRRSVEGAIPEGQPQTDVALGMKAPLVSGGKLC